eukprot:Gb_36829 [translate_table: standard]
MPFPTEGDMDMDMVVQMDEYWFWKNVLCAPMPTSKIPAAPLSTIPCVHNGNHNPSVECSNKDEEPPRQRLFDRRHCRSSSDHMCLDLSQLGIQRHGVHKRATSLDFTTLHKKAGIQQPATVHKIPDQQPLPIKESRHMNNSKEPKLETIASGKAFEEPAQTKTDQEVGKAILHHRERKKGVKSLTDLEFEELKGFMDLGFNFSKDDLTPRVVSMIPGLQHLGKQETTWAPTVSRPYLSEAWLIPRTDVPLPNWHMPAPHEQGVKMKEHLKFWAHAVASTVRMEC